KRNKRAVERQRDLPAVSVSRTKQIHVLCHDVWHQVRRMIKKQGKFTRRNRANGLIQSTPVVERETRNPYRIPANVETFCSAIEFSGCRGLEHVQPPKVADVHISLDDECRGDLSESGNAVTENRKAVERVYRVTRKHDHVRVFGRYQFRQPGFKPRTRIAM